MHRLPGDGAVAEGNEEEVRSRDQGVSYMGSQGVPYMETVYGTKEEVVQGEDAPLRKGLMWLQKGKLFSRYECKVKEILQENKEIDDNLAQDNGKVRLPANQL